jgi:hypothetical protein
MIDDFRQTSTPEQQAAGLADADLLRRAASLIRDRAMGDGGRWQTAYPTRGALHHKIIDDGVVIADIYAIAPVVEWMTTLTPAIGLQLAKVLHAEAQAAEEGPGAGWLLVELACQILGEPYGC